MRIRGSLKRNVILSLCEEAKVTIGHGNPRVLLKTLAGVTFLSSTRVQWQNC